MVFPYLTSLFSQKNKTPHILAKKWEKFPELEQGQLYLRRRNMIQRSMKRNLKLIESFQNSQASIKDWAANKGCPGDGSVSWCHGGADGCPSYSLCESSSARPAPGSWLQGPVASPPSPPPQQNLPPDWAVNASCPATGAKSWCHTGPNANAPLAPPAPGNCPNYSYCPGVGAKLKWQQDKQINIDNYNSNLAQFININSDYHGKLSDYISNPPTELSGQNVVVSSLTGKASPFPSLGTITS